MIIGIDFDNTIADYTGVFYDVATDLGWLPTNVGTSKNEVKSYFIDNDIEDKWTELQGIVYGKEITRAKPYANCVEVLKQLHAQGHQLYIISHKTKYPIIGEKVNFHIAATNWLKANAIIGQENSPVSNENVFFNETKEQKLDRAGHLKCDVFLDDLPSILQHEKFPQNCQGVLFNPYSIDNLGLNQVSSWQSVLAMI